MWGTAAQLPTYPQAARRARTRSSVSYGSATMAMKERALAKATPPTGNPGRYQPGDRLLGFLSSL